MVTVKVTRISHFQNGGSVGLGEAGISYYTLSRPLEAQQDLKRQTMADACAAVARDIAQVLVQSAER